MFFFLSTNAERLRESILANDKKNLSGVGRPFVSGIGLMSGAYISSSLVYILISIVDLKALNPPSACLLTFCSTVKMKQKWEKF